MTPSERGRCFTWISFITLTPQAAAKTARSYCYHSAMWKNIDRRYLYEYISSCSSTLLLLLLPPQSYPSVCLFSFEEPPVFAVQRLSLFVMVLQNSSAECEVLGYRKWGCSLTRGPCDEWRHLTIVYPATWTWSC